MNQYETVFILNPVLSDDQVKETVKKFENFLTDRGAKNGSQRRLGPKKIGLCNRKQEKWFLPPLSI